MLVSLYVYLFVLSSLVSVATRVIMMVSLYVFWFAFHVGLLSENVFPLQILNHHESSALVHHCGCGNHKLLFRNFIG